MRPTQSMRVAAVILAALVVLALAATAGARSITGTTGNDRLVGTPRSGRDPRHRRTRRAPRARRGRLSRRRSRPRHDGRWARSRSGASSPYDGSRDLVRCGAGADVVNADLVDAVARDCELVGRRVSRDPYRNDGAQHESEVEPDSFTFGRTTVATFQVGRRFEGGATNVGFAVTTRRRGHMAQRLPPRPDGGERPAGSQRAGERPGGRVRRATRHVAHLDARARRAASRGSRSTAPPTASAGARR